MALLPITASGQWWSATKGWFTPPLGRNSISISVTGALTNGTIVVFRRRLMANFNGGSPGTPVQLLVMDAAYISARGKTGCSDDFSGLSTVFEYDIGVPTTFGSGDSLSVELI